MWMDGVAHSQTRSKPLNPPKSPRKFPFLTRISSFVFPNLTKTLGWVHTFGKTFPIKTGIFLGGLPIKRHCIDIRLRTLGLISSLVTPLETPSMSLLPPSLLDLLPPRPPTTTTTVTRATAISLTARELQRPPLAATQLQPPSRGGRARKLAVPTTPSIQTTKTLAERHLLYNGILDTKLKG